MYCIDNSSITLSTLGFKGKDEEILNLYQEKAAKINSEKMAEILKSRLVNFRDKSGGEVIFIKNCDEFAKLQMEFLKALTNEYPEIKFSQIPIITPQNHLPRDFEIYRFQKLSLGSLTSQKGTFRANFMLPNDTSKTLFFKYEFQATMPVLMAVKQISSKHILNVLDYTFSQIEFSKFSKEFFTQAPISKMISKTNINQGEILSKKHFQMLSMVKKGDNIQAVLNDGSLNISIEVKALEDGNLGDVIKVRSKDKKVFYATIISKKQVLIR